MLYSKLLVIWYPRILISHPTSKNVKENIPLFIKYSESNLWCLYVHLSHEFSEPLLAALPIIFPSTDAITIVASWICEHITVCLSKMFRPSIFYVVYENSHTRSEMKMCCFDFRLGFCKSLSSDTGRCM
jgi:hypothetical protein